MRLWTTMAKTVYDQTLGKHESYTCKTEKCDMLNFDGPTGQYHKAYNWLVYEMTKRIGPAPNGITYPVWAWHTVRGLHKRPNLHWNEFRNAPEPMVLIELEVDDDKVVLTDEEIWTCGQLNDAPCFMDAPDEQLDAELEWYYENTDIPQSEKEKFKMSTWSRIFNTEKSEHIQATFWELKPENVKKVWYYNKKKNIK